MGDRVKTTRESSRKFAPATTPEGREQQLVSLAMDAVEKRIRNGTATAQELVYFIKAGSPSAKYERNILQKQQELITAKTEAIQSQKRVEELYANALNAMKAYSGASINPEEDDYDD